MCRRQGGTVSRIAEISGLFFILSFNYARLNPVFPDLIQELELAAHVRLAVDIVDMVVHGLEGTAELAADLLDEEA